MLFELEDRERYKEGRQIGQGGMGAVLRVLEGNLCRRVAKKVILGEANSSAIKRFVTEARITGQLEHPNIVPVHEFARDEYGQLYFTMKMIEGKSLENVLDEVAERNESYSLFSLLQIFMKICDAISFAHSKHVIHRDLKPDNVMIGKFGEVLVVDWGLAKRLDQEDADETMTIGSEGYAGRTLEGDVIGTPSYMPPEQAEGEIDGIDERSDIFALGAILYKILTFEPPYSGTMIYNILAKAIRGEFVSPIEKAPENFIPPEVESICMKAMALKKRDRYQQVSDLVEDVQSHLDGRLVRAHRYSFVEKMGRFFHKYWKVFGVVGLVLVLVSFLVIAMLKISERFRQAEQEKKAMIEKREALVRQKNDYLQAIALNRQAVNAGNGGEHQKSLDLVARSRKLADLPPTYFIASICLYHLEQYEEAIREGKRGWELMPDHNDLALNLARCYERIGKDDEALKVYYNLERQFPKAWRSKKEIGRMLFREEKYQEALGYFIQALEAEDRGLMPQIMVEDIQKAIKVCRGKMEKK